MAWSSSDRRAHLPRGWAKLRAKVLERDGHRCQIRGPACTIHATEVDHIGHRDDHDLGSLRAVCTACHTERTTEQAADARATIRGRRYRAPEPHPGLVTESDGVGS